MRLELWNGRDEAERRARCLPHGCRHKYRWPSDLWSRCSVQRMYNLNPRAVRLFRVVEPLI